jgi:glycine cleavage system H protein
MQDRAHDVPRDRHYEGTNHLWVRADTAEGPESARVRLGIDGLGLESLGELAYVSLREVGTSFARGDSVGSLEAAKMTSSITAPIAGTVVARNDAVLSDPLLVNQDPYERGWLLEIEPANWEAEAGELIHGDAIQPWVAAETKRLSAETLADR